MRRLKHLANSLKTMMAAALVSLSLIGELAAQTAGDVMTKMTPEQSVSYINGVIEGLAIARWVRDKPDSSGMTCIYDWRYKDPSKKNDRVLLKWLENNPEHPPGALIYTLLNRECPSQ